MVLILLVLRCVRGGSCSYGFEVCQRWFLIFSNGFEVCLSRFKT